MRHMETSMGESQVHWASGLRKDGKKQLNYLRAKYALAILLSDVNNAGIDIKTESTSHFRNFTKHEAFDYDRVILHTDYLVDL